MAQTGIDVNLVAEGAVIRDLPMFGRMLAQRNLRGAWITVAAERTRPASVAGQAPAFEDAGGVFVVPVLVPPSGAEGETERLRAFAQTTRSRVARICPTAHRYPLADWVLSPLPEVCARERLTLLLDFEPQPVRWDEIVNFAHCYPSVPMVVLGVSLDADHAAPAALDYAPNLLIQVSGLEPVARLARLIAVFGSSRFVWGTGAANAGRDGRAVILHEFDAPTSHAILHGNALSLADGSYASTHL